MNASWKTPRALATLNEVATSGLFFNKGCTDRKNVISSNICKIILIRQPLRLIEAIFLKVYKPL